jgi:hypothetical protein
MTPTTMTCRRRRLPPHRRLTLRWCACSVSVEVIVCAQDALLAAGESDLAERAHNADDSARDDDALFDDDSAAPRVTRQTPCVVGVLAFVCACVRAECLGRRVYVLTGTRQAAH